MGYPTPTRAGLSGIYQRPTTNAAGLTIPIYTIPRPSNFHAIRTHHVATFALLAPAADAGLIRLMRYDPDDGERTYDLAREPRYIKGRYYRFDGQTWIPSPEPTRRRELKP